MRQIDAASCGRAKSAPRTTAIENAESVTTPTSAKSTVRGAASAPPWRAHATRARRSDRRCPARASSAQIAAANAPAAALEARDASFGAQSRSEGVERESGPDCPRVAIPAAPDRPRSGAADCGSHPGSGRRMDFAMAGGSVRATAVARGPTGWVAFASCPRCAQPVATAMTLDLCRALCACGCGFEIDALDAPVQAHSPALSGAANAAGAVREEDEIAPATEAARGRGETPAVRGSSPPAPAAYASDRTPRR